MFPKLLKPLALLAVLPAGCVSYDTRGYDVALRTNPDQPLTMPYRSQAYLLVLNGSNPTEDPAFFRLRKQLAEAGFPMVYYAQRADRDFFHRELHRLRRDQPPARFVLAGYGSGAGPARELALTAAGEGLPVDALCLLDPTGSDKELVFDPGTVPLTVVRSHNWTAGRNLPTADVTEVAGTGHLSLPDHPTTVATLVRLLAASAAKVVLEPVESLPHLPLTDRPQPPPRPPLPALIEPVKTDPPAGLAPRMQ